MVCKKINGVWKELLHDYVSGALDERARDSIESFEAHLDGDELSFEEAELKSYLSQPENSPEEFFHLEALGRRRSTGRKPKIIAGQTSVYWAKKLNCDSTALTTRLKRGWDEAKILSMPIGSRNKPINGKTIKEWSLELGEKYATVQRRFRRAKLK